MTGNIKNSDAAASEFAFTVSVFAPILYENKMFTGSGCSVRKWILKLRQFRGCGR